MELFISVVVVTVALMYSVIAGSSALRKEKRLTQELSRKLYEANTIGGLAQRKLDSIVIKARKEAGQDPSRL